MDPEEVAYGAMAQVYSLRTKPVTHVPEAQGARKGRKARTEQRVAGLSTDQMVRPIRRWIDNERSLGRNAWPQRRELRDELRTMLRELDSLEHSLG